MAPQAQYLSPARPVPTPFVAVATAPDAADRAAPPQAAPTVGTGDAAAIAADTPPGSGTEAGLGVARGGVGSSFIPPEPERTARPAYPPSARRHGWEGEVLLRVRIDSSGGVSTVRVERSSGHEVLDLAATQAVRSWLFRPARYGLQPVIAEVRVPVQFRLAEL